MAESQTTDFDPKTTSPMHDKFSPGWQLNLDFYEMAEHILRDGTYLDMFGKGTDKAESTAQYAWRKQASFAMDVCAELVGIRIGNLFRMDPVRHYEDSPYAKLIEGFLSDVDGGGTSMNKFMKRAMTLHYVNGVDIVVDKTRLDVEPDTLLQEQDAGARPYLSMFSPLERLDWSVDHAGIYKWVRYDLGEKPSEAENSCTGERQYLTLTTTGWTLYTVSSDDLVKNLALSDDHKLGVVPVVTFYWGESVKAENRKIPLSLLTRAAPIARAMLNLVSQGELDLYMAIGILAAIGVDDDRLPTEISPNCWLSFPAGASVKHITAAVEHIAEKREWLDVFNTQILRIGKLTGVTGELMGRASSGLQVAIERTDLDNEMAATAEQAGHVEVDVMRMMVSRSEGKPITAEELGYSVAYNKEYVFTGVDELIKNAKGLGELDIQRDVPALMRVLLDRIRAAVLRSDDPRSKEVIKQIEAAMFKSEFDVDDLSGKDDNEDDEDA